MAFLSVIAGKAIFPGRSFRGNTADAVRASPQGTFLCLAKIRDIAHNIKMIVLDTNVLVAALRSTTGFSRVLLRRVLLGDLPAGVSVPLFLEYEAVLTRPRHLAAFGLAEEEVVEFLDGLAGRLLPVEISYHWRPQLRDAGDEMVLEAAANGGASHLVTWNTKDFLPAAEQFGIAVVTPHEFIATQASILKKE